jgi:hypothetical protein
MFYKPLLGLPVPPSSLRHGWPHPLPRLPISVNLTTVQLAKDGLWLESDH